MTSLYDQIGGVALRSVVNDFCERMFSDPIICFLFAGKDKHTLEQRECEMIAAMLGANVKYTGRTLKAAHARSLILEGHFYRRAMILEQTLIDHKVPLPVRKAWVEHTFNLQPEIKHAVIRRQLPKRFELFVGTPEQREMWKSWGIEILLQQTWNWVLLKIAESASSTAPDIECRLRSGVMKARQELVAFQFEAAVETIAGLLEFVLSPAQAQKQVTRRGLRALVIALTSFAPRMTEALWEQMDEPGLVYLQRYPVFHDLTNP